jgi:hypothetical protein
MNDYVWIGFQNLATKGPTDLFKTYVSMDRIVDPVHAGSVVSASAANPLQCIAHCLLLIAQ